jgi:hypothetical protein
MSARKRKPQTGVGPEAALPALTHEAIERRAHEIFLARGAEPGRDLEDWLEAERQLADELRLGEARRGNP